MPRFIFESGCEKLAPVMVKGRLPAHASPVLALFLLAAAGASAQTAPPTLGVLVNQVLALFPKVNGDVLEVQGTTLTLSLGQRDGLVAGVELTAYREGRELRHPKTGEVLGRTEEVLGRVTVQQVQEAYATGAVVEGTDIRPGDKVRVSAGKIKLTLLPIVEGVRDGLVEAATYELIEALNRTGRFQIALGDAVNVWLAQQGIRRQDVLEGKGLAQVAPRFKIENLLVVAFSRVQNKPYIDVRLFTFPGPNALLTTALFVPPAIKATPKGDFSASGKPKESQTPTPVRSLLSRLLTGDLDAAEGDREVPLRVRGNGGRGGPPRPDPAYGRHRWRADLPLQDDRAGARAGMDLPGGRARARLQRAARRPERRRRARGRGQSLSPQPPHSGELAHPHDEGRQAGGAGGRGAGHPARGGPEW